MSETDVRLLTAARKGNEGAFLESNPIGHFVNPAAGWADHGILRFKHGEDLVEIYSKSSVLQKSDYGTVWVYHEPMGDRSIKAAEVLRLQQELAELRKTYTPKHPAVLRVEKQLAYVRAEAMFPFDLKTFEIRTAEKVEWLIPKKQQ